MNLYKKLEANIGEQGDYKIHKNTINDKLMTEGRAVIRQYSYNCLAKFSIHGKDILYFVFTRIRSSGRGYILQEEVPLSRLLKPNRSGTYSMYSYCTVQKL